MKELRIDRNRAIRVAAMVALALIGVSALPGLLRTPEAPGVPPDVGFLPTERTTAGLRSGLGKTRGRPGKTGARSGPKTGLTVRRGARNRSGAAARRAGRGLNGKRKNGGSGMASSSENVVAAADLPASSPTAAAPAPVPGAGPATESVPASGPGSGPPSGQGSPRGPPGGAGSAPGRPPTGSGDGSEEFAPR